MIKILLNGHEAALPADIEVTLNYKNYFLNPEREDSTYPLTLPLSSNRHIFGFEERSNYPYVKKEYRAAVYCPPFRLIEGRAVVTDINDSNIELFITTDKNSFWGDAKNKYLDDIGKVYLGRETYSTFAELLAAFTDSLHNVKDFIACPLFERRDGKPEREYNSSYFDSADERLQMIPFVRLSALIRRIFTSQGYTITHDAILNEPGFCDIIIICVRRVLSNPDRFFYYNSFLPHLTLYDFLIEIEKKFCLSFSINSGSRMVSIFSLSDILPVYNLPVCDGIQKHILEEDESGSVKGVIFKDKGIQDKYLADYKTRLEFTYGEKENAETIECISTIVGVDTSTWVEDDSQGNVMYCAQQFAAIHYPETDDDKYNERITHELRFSVYRGICCKPYDGLYNYYEYPLASPVGFPYTQSQYSLLSDSLFEKYHCRAYETKAAFREEHDFTVPAQIGNLKNINTIFESEPVIRNRKYICSEQQIILSAKGIKEYTVKCLT